MTCHNIGALRCMCLISRGDILFDSSYMTSGKGKNIEIEKRSVGARVGS